MKFSYQSGSLRHERGSVKDVGFMGRECVRVWRGEEEGWGWGRRGGVIVGGTMIEYGRFCRTGFCSTGRCD